MTDKEAFSIYKDIFYSPEVSAEDQHGTIVKRVDEIMHLYRDGAGAEYGRNTLYNVLQGVTDYYSNQIRSRTESAKFWSSFYGAGEKVKLDVQNRLLEMAD